MACLLPATATVGRFDRRNETAASLVAKVGTCAKAWEGKKRAFPDTAKATLSGLSHRLIIAYGVI